MELCLSWGIVKLGFGLTLFQEANIGLRGYKHPTEGVTSVILVNMSTEVELSACLTITADLRNTRKCKLIDIFFIKIIEKHRKCMKKFNYWFSHV